MTMKKGEHAPWYLLPERAVHVVPLMQAQMDTVDMGLPIVGKFAAEHAGVRL